MPKTTTEKDAACFSEQISEVCRLMEDAKKDYAWSQSEISRMEKLTQDYLHMLELDDLDYRERAKLATKLRDCRRTRREYKDTAVVLEPLVLFLESEKGRNMLNLLREALGKTRKTEERMKNRYYRPRALWNVPEESP